MKDKRIYWIGGIILLIGVLYFTGVFELLSFALIEPGNSYRVEISTNQDIISASPLNYPNENMMSSISLVDVSGNSYGELVFSGNSAYSDSGDSFLYGTVDLTGSTTVAPDGNYNIVCTSDNYITRCAFGNSGISYVLIGKFNPTFDGISVISIRSVDTPIFGTFDLGSQVEGVTAEVEIMFWTELQAGYGFNVLIENIQNVPNGYYDGMCYKFNIVDRGTTADLDGDGFVQANDISIMNTLIAGGEAICFNTEQELIDCNVIADLDGDGFVQANDLNIISNLILFGGDLDIFDLDMDNYICEVELTQIVEAQTVASSGGGGGGGGGVGGSIYFCGNDICEDDETCLTCEVDCGVCEEEEKVYSYWWILLIIGGIIYLYNKNEK